MVVWRRHQQQLQYPQQPAKQQPLIQQKHLKLKSIETKEVDVTVTTTMTAKQNGWTTMNSNKQEQHYKGTIRLCGVGCLFLMAWQVY